MEITLGENGKGIPERVDSEGCFLKRPEKSAVLVEPGAGVGTCGLTCEVFLAGIIVGCLYKSCSNAPVTDGTRDVCMDDVHDPSSQDICKIGGMTFYLDLETT